MSVTFAIESIPTGAFQFACHDNEAPAMILLRAATYDAAVQELAAHKESCATCGAFGACVQAVMDIDDSFDVNVSQSNASVLLEVLGLIGEDPSDLYGAATGEAFLGHVLLALAEDRDDSGAGWTTSHQGARGMTFVDCGRRPGYFADVLGRLHELATEAVRLGREIHWS